MTRHVEKHLPFVDDIGVAAPSRGLADAAVMDVVTYYIDRDDYKLAVHHHAAWLKGIARFVSDRWSCYAESHGVADHEEADLSTAPSAAKRPRAAAAGAGAGASAVSVASAGRGCADRFERRFELIPARTRADGTTTRPRTRIMYKS